jgi:hypothetical protein
VPFVAIKLQTANGFSVTSSLTDWGGKTLDLNKDRPTPIFAKGSGKKKIHQGACRTRFIERDTRYPSRNEGPALPAK